MTGVLGGFQSAMTLVQNEYLRAAEPAPCPQTALIRQTNSLFPPLPLFVFVHLCANIIQNNAPPHPHPRA